MHNNLVSYKNVEISPNVSPIIKYMEPVEENREKLYELSLNWDNLSLLSQLGNAGMNMDEIKSNFTKLSSELINYLANELLKKHITEMNSKAQTAVDIVIRNLFERTADIGFLATDEDIRSLLRTHPNRYSSSFAEDVASIKNRFVEYIGKYSVYYDIVLMNTNGDIIATLDDTLGVTKSNDPIIAQTLSTSEEYVETYKHHDFLPNEDKSLVYSYRVTQSNTHDSQALGVLCLCFKFDDEMKGIFENLVNTQTKECIMLLSEDGEVIASSDAYHVPVGATLDIVKDESYKIISFGGRDYLATSTQTNGYQGFEGLGWYGHIMLPLEHAFNAMGEDHFQMSRELLLAILQNGNQFSDELKEIPLRANSIQHNLNRAIWNGNIKQSSAQNNHNKQFSRALLQEIRKTGEHTKNIIGSAIARLTKTMVLSNSAFLADLIVDIMDRNLYERANDCRWWALTSDFRTIMDKEHITPQDQNKMNEILAYINDLYTVYTNLFIYDTNGVIISVSNPRETHLIGQKLSYEWVNKTLEIQDSSKYYVSQFEATPLYANRPTYIYNASIRSLEDESRVVGGIGIVFDSAVQFETMIVESLPKQEDGTVKDGLFAVLATSNQMIIASNDHEHMTGDFLKIDRKFFELNVGDSCSQIIQYKGKYYALGVTCSKGYREFKSSKDDYVNNVYSFFFSYISDVNETIVKEEHAFSLEKDISIDSNEASVDIASFMIGSQQIGVHSDKVIEAVSANELQETLSIDNNHHYRGNIVYQDHVVSIIDIQNFINESCDDPYNEIVILKFDEKNYIGILVHSLGDIPEIEIGRIRPLQEYIIGAGTLVDSVVFPAKSSQNKEVLSLLSIEKIYAQLVRPNKSHMIPRALSA